MIISILDLGTNTFNLLIVRVENGVVGEKLYNKKIPSKIGMGGINNALISEEAFARGIDALCSHKKTIDYYKTDKLFAFGTSALRNASNSHDFVEAARKKAGIDISIISGIEEAELIFHGNKLAFEWEPEKPYLIMDIGGGSNEFIIADTIGVKWMHSFELGVSRLLQKFHPSAPITEHEQKTISEYINQNLQLLYDAVEKYSVSTLIGSSGSFDTFRSVIEINSKQIVNGNAYEIALEDYYSLQKRIYQSTREEISAIEGMDQSRVEMIALACLLVDNVLKHCGIEQIIQSSFSLKEGAIWKLLNKN